VEGAAAYLHHDSQSNPGVVQLTADDESEVEAAVLLLKCMYSPADAGKPLEGASQSVLLQVLRLADQLQAQPCEAAAARALAASSPLDWSTVLAVYSLPPSYSNNAAYQPLYNAAAAALQTQLGDLDAAWLDDGKAEQLLALSFAVLMQLLYDYRTCACENTVYYTCCAWIDRHEADEEQRSELLECVRMPHISTLYLATVVSSSISQLTDSITPADLLHAAAYAAQPATVKESMLRWNRTLIRHQTWQLPKRPASSAQSAEVEWLVPLSELKQLYEDALGKGMDEQAWAASPQVRAFGGLQWCIEMRAWSTDAGVEMGVFAQLMPLPGNLAEDGMLRAEFKLTIGPAVFTLDRLVEVRRGEGVATHPFKLGPQPAWQEEAWSGWADDDGRVPLRLEVSRVE